MEFVNEYPALNSEEFSEVNYLSLKYITKKNYKIYNLIVFIVFTLFIHYYIGLWKVTCSFAGVMIVFIWLQPSVTARIALITLKKRHSVMKSPKSLINRVAFGRDIQIYWGEELVAISQLDQAKAFMLTDNFILLVLEGDSVVAFKKNAFLTGTSEGFMKELRKLGIKKV